jgi:hypothetical protein
MQILSARWTTSFGAFTLGAQIKSVELDAAFHASAIAFAPPANPEKVMKLCSPCGMFDPTGPAVGHSFLDGNGNTWIGVGTRMYSNAPSPSLVEAEFRRLAKERFGDEWSTAKKSKLNYQRKVAKTNLAGRTPFRLGEVGALFICLQSGETISVGHGGEMVAKDLCGRIESLTRVNFASIQKEMPGHLLSWLRLQDEATLPWPTGTVSLFRRRMEFNESASVRMLNWSQGSQDAADLLSQSWKPSKIQVQWGDGRFATIGMTGRIGTVSWGGKVEGDDPSELIESRLTRLLAMDAEVRAKLIQQAPLLEV